ncbi:M24 family metallopeptidase [Virgibacillus siamensis]|uniref:M24 family metallopeptidase n=1 Tax=Virgibacillus siamensis TaxID=480071 RepID=UPI0009866DE0|nr:Xaa-Pro peptidase family protein [Virgibacillus siamensis]
MEKITKLRNQFDDLGIDGMLITNDQNRRYMTGFTGTAGIVLISKSEAKLITDFRYVDQAKTQATDFDVILHKNRTIDEIDKQIASSNITKLGFEENHVTYNTFKTFSETIHAELVPTSKVIENLRLIKSKDEIETIKKAAHIADETFSHIIDYIHPGITEMDVNHELEATMRKLGATSSAFDIIVASGSRSALPHGVASEKVIEKGDMVTLDFGAYYNGYRSDITRTVAVGKPDKELEKVYSIVREALSRGAEGLKPNMAASAVDALPRDYITAKGFGSCFGHGAGHGIGLDIHEEPFFSKSSDKLTEPGMVVTIEPGIYIPELGGVRIENDYLVTTDGNETLSQSTTELIVL